MNNKIILFVIFSLSAFIFYPAYAQEYTIYVEELPEWANYASNVMYVSTQAWKDANEGWEFYKSENPTDVDFRIQWVKDFGGERVGYAYGDEFIEVGLGDSKCNGQWNPYSEKHISHIMKHEMGHIFGFEHNDDPNSLMYPIALNKEYGIVEQEYRLSEGYGQFISFCTIKDLTSYYFSISTTDDTYGFDYYVVPSYDEFVKWSENKAFQHYSNDDCFGEGWLSAFGTCKGISKDAGIIVLMDNKLTTQLETITVKQVEKPYITNLKSPLDTKLFISKIVNDEPVIDSSTLTLEQNKILDLEKKIVSLESSIGKLKRINQQHVKNSEVIDERVEALKKQIQELQENKKISKKEIASFVDRTKDPQSYVDRYHNEPKYKKWFDENYQEYSSIYEAVGKNPPLPDWIKNNAGWWAEGKLSENEFIRGIEYLIDQRIIITN